MRVVAIDAFMRVMGRYSKHKLLGLDFGTKHIGIAVSDENNQIAFPLASYARKIESPGSRHGSRTIEDFRTLFANSGDLTSKGPEMLKESARQYRMSDASIEHASRHFSRLLAEHQIGAVIVGYPLREDGSPTPLCDEILQFMLSLDVSAHKTSAGDPICTMWDEFGSTSAARQQIGAFSSRLAVVKKQKDAVAASIILQSFLDYMNQTQQR